MVVLMQHKFTKHRLNNGCASSERICFAAYANDSKKHAIKSIINKIKSAEIIINCLSLMANFTDFIILVFRNQS